MVFTCIPLLADKPGCSFRCRLGVERFCLVKRDVESLARTFLGSSVLLYLLCDGLEAGRHASSVSSPFPVLRVANSSSPLRLPFSLGSDRCGMWFSASQQRLTVRKSSGVRVLFVRAWVCFKDVRCSLPEVDMLMGIISKGMRLAVQHKGERQRQEKLCHTDAQQPLPLVDAGNVSSLCWARRGPLRS